MNAYWGVVREAVLTILVTFSKLNVAVLFPKPDNHPVVFCTYSYSLRASRAIIQKRLGGSSSGVIGTYRNCFQCQHRNKF